MCELNCEKKGWEPCIDSNSGVTEEVSFVELGKVWQAPLYEITIDISQINEEDEENKASPINQHLNQKLLPIFNNFISNETSNDVVAEFLTSQYVLPKDSSFYMMTWIVALTVY